MAAGRGNTTQEYLKNGLMDPACEIKPKNGHINGKNKNGLNGKNGAHEQVRTMTFSIHVSISFSKIVLTLVRALELDD